MATKKVKVVKTDMKTECIKADPSMYSKEVPQYKFSNGRMFTKPQRQEYANYPDVE